MLKLEKPKLAIISNSPVITQLSAFHLETQYNSHVFSYKSKEEFLKEYRKNFDVIIYDSATIPNLSSIDAQFLVELESPFQYSTFTRTIAQKLSASTAPQYLPIRLEFLLLIEKIKVPLFLKLNENKFLKIEHANSVFSLEKFNQNKQKGLGILYILSSDVDELIQDYIKSSLCKIAWQQADQFVENMAVNMETMKTFADKIGWSPQVLELAQFNVKKALSLAKRTKNLEAAFRQFQKIEKFGFADRCLLMTLVTTQLAQHFLAQDPDAQVRQTYACLFHDITLTEDLINNQNKLLQQIKTTSLSSSKSLQEFSLHTIRAATLCKNWNLCPMGVDQIILNHHEEPDGSGFPYGKFDLEMNLDSIIFNVALDFANHYFSKFGEYTPQDYLQDQAAYLKSDLFRPVLTIFATIK